MEGGTKKTKAARVGRAVPLAVLARVFGFFGFGVFFGLGGPVVLAKKIKNPTLRVWGITDKEYARSEIDKGLPGKATEIDKG